MSIISQILVHICVIQLVSSRYELLVEIHSFVNPDGRCPDMGCLECCEGGCPATNCHYYFSICQRPPGTAVSFVPSLGQGNCVVNTSNPVGSNPNDPHLFHDSVYGLDNPMMYFGEVWSSEGSQIHLELIDNDPNGNEELIDRFIVNATLSVGTSDTQTYPGIFGFAELNLTLTLQCAEDFYDADCNRFCLTNCECGPGLTGPFCTESIDDCENVTCGENMMCDDSHLSFNCVCVPGYTDPNCTIDIDECAGVNCTVGTCQQGKGFFTCMCPPGYSGQFCEEELDSFEVTITIEAVINHEGRCADKDCTSRGGCCDRDCPQLDCDYYLRYCLRPIDTPVSYEPAPFQEGECKAFNSLTERRANIFEFTYRTLTLSARVWNLEGIQIFFELIDKDFSINEGEDDLIDRFVVNVTSLMTTRGLYRGIFGMADLSITAEVACHEQFSGGQFCVTSTASKSTTQAAATVFTMLISETPTTAAITGIIALLVFIVVVLAFTIVTTALCVGVCVLGRQKRRLKFDLHNRSFKEQGAENAALEDSPSNEVIELQPHSTLRNRLESNPNNYAKLYCEPSTIKGDATTPTTQEQTKVTVFENSIYSSSSPLPAKENEVAYEYIPQDLQNDNDEYDYESPYWAPAEKKNELLRQFRTLRIPSVAQKDLELKAQLGRGAFGEVYKGVWQRVVIGCEEPVEEEVAVKTMEDTSKEEDRIKFLQEAVIMGQFDHPNIVKIMGIMATGDEYKIIMEFMANGDLRSHLPTLASRFPKAMELSSQLLYYSRQVASGMGCLSMKGYVHRDLAARNVLVSKDDICKIGDFGLSRDLQHEDTYLAQKGGKVPVKWTAPEALNYRLYSTASDVWSFGCVLYEIWSLGVKPFHELKNSEALLKISCGYRLPPPPGCPRAVYDIMIKCWNEDTDLRPGPYEICSQLNLPEFRVLKWSDEDIAKYSEEARTVGAPLDKGEEFFKELQNTYRI